MTQKDKTYVLVFANRPIPVHYPANTTRPTPSLKRAVTQDRSALYPGVTAPQRHNGINEDTVDNSRNSISNGDVGSEGVIKQLTKLHRAASAPNNVPSGPSTIEDDCFYFEVEIESDGCGGVGLVSAPNNQYYAQFDTIPGQMDNSIGLGSDGRLIKNGHSIFQTRSFGIGDTVGCGWKTSQGCYFYSQVFFTLNGDMLDLDFNDNCTGSFSIYSQGITPAVAVMGESQVLGNFGRVGTRPFKWSPKPANIDSSKEDNRLPQISTLQHKTSVRRLMSSGRKSEMSKEYTNNLEESKEYTNNSESKDYTNNLEESRNYARTVLNNPQADHSLLEQLLPICKDKQKEVLSMIDELSSITPPSDTKNLLQNAIETNDILQEAIKFAEESLAGTLPPKKPKSRKQRPEVEDPRIVGSSVQKLVENKDVFCLICMLRGSSSSTRKEAAKGLESLAKKGEVRDEIKSAGGMHSLLNLFKSTPDKNEELKLISARAIAYLVPSFTQDPNHPHGSLELKVMDCLRYLFNTKNHGDERTVMEARKAATEGLTHFWYNVLQPICSDSNFILSTIKRSSSRMRGRTEHRQGKIEMQELLETTVALIMDVANSETQNKSESSQDMRLSAALVVESMCTAEEVRPVAVREGLIKVLVRWLGSNHNDLMGPAVKSLRNLTLSQDEYMAGWIHSQIVNENALPAIVSLGMSGPAENRLAIAQILSSLSVAPHTRAAIVDANGLSYLVSILSESVAEDASDDPLVLESLSAILQLAAGASSYANLSSSSLGWRRNDRDVIDGIVQGGALDPLVKLASYAHRVKSRQDSVENLQIISEDVRPQCGIRSKLCDVGAARALGNILRQDTPFLVDQKQLSLSSHSIGSSSVAQSFENKSVESSEALKELGHSLRCLANILEPPRQEARLALKYVSFSLSRTSFAKVVVDTVESGGLKSLISIAKRPVETNSYELTASADLVDPNDLLVESFRSLASLCPLLLSSEGHAQWAVHILYVLTAALSWEHTNDDDEAIIEDIQRDALRGLCSLARYEPLKMKIISPKSLSLLLGLKNAREGNSHLAQAATQVCFSLGFSEEDMDVQLAGNDPKLLSDWFCFERSLLVQAMAREEIRNALCYLWLEAAGEAMNLPLERNALKQLSRLFINLVDDSNCAEQRNILLAQYFNIYENKLFDDINDDLEQPCEESFPGLVTLNGTGSGEKLREQDWILSHRKALKSYNNNSMNSELPEHISSVPLTVRVQSLLDFYFPSILLQSEVVPLYDFKPETSFDFRALVMPEKPKYFSFRREGNVISRICEKVAGSTESDDAHWTLVFRNSSFAGEFAETLVQALYRCPMIRSISFLRRDHGANDADNEGSKPDNEGSKLLAYLAGSLPPWIGYLTFDNVLNKDAIIPLVRNLETIGQRNVGNQQSYTGNLGAKAFSTDTLHGLAIRNSPLLGEGDTLEPLFNLLGFVNSVDSSFQPPLMSLRMLDLRGNKLGDASCARLLEVVHSEKSCCCLEKLDLSDNNIGKGLRIFDVLCAYINEYRQRQSSGFDDSSNGIWCTPLKLLKLESNNLRKGSVASYILQNLSNNAFSLESLSLADNGLMDTHFERLPSALAKNTNLIELDISRNNLTKDCMEKIIRSLKSEERKLNLAFLRMDLNKPNLGSYPEMLNKTLSVGRLNRVKQYINESRLSNGVKSHDSRLYPKTTFLPSPLQNNSQVTSPTMSTTNHYHNSPSTEINKKHVEFNARDSSHALSKPSTEDRTLSGIQGNQITVLFSAPLVWKKTGTDLLVPIEMLDLETERELLWQCFKEASVNIDLFFDNATTDRLRTVMTKGCGCLHYSGHGSPDYLIFEDGKGGLHWLGSEKLKKFITEGAKNNEPPFRFVFVSACYSFLTGEAFVDAGVPHVVCCQQEAQLADSAALAFTRAFYLALAIGRTVKDSFELGRQAVEFAPSVPNSDLEMKKFVLLPKDGDHDVRIFDAKSIPVWPRKNAANSVPSLRNIYSRAQSMILAPEDLLQSHSSSDQPLPTPPQGFLGRETDMYHVLNAVLDRRFVNVVGKTGIGRSSLASSLCQYINDRKTTMIEIETIFYIRARKSSEKERNDGSFITPLYNQLVASGKISSSIDCTTLDEKGTHIFKSLNKLKALIVLERAEVLSGDEIQELPLFLRDLFEKTQKVRVLMTSKSKLGVSLLGNVGEHVYNLGQLNFKNTVRLFAHFCQHVHTGEERRKVLEDLVPDDQQLVCHSDESGIITSRSREILEILGTGVPARIMEQAHQIKKEDYDKLMEIARRQCLAY
eukprot:CAMPEP_0194375938 /NCGR_PEP_ID=MMETSP0174-20130528/24497_1 /TAXON_ID=216777 /ORGANISM="Proboscia alata, Strain PI-D3" /LENGTH=2279 /DNA_ID=CAMNT_0039156461 /DNA_START=633 /DNA_END=7472 /DNA_ORIENTATION=+